MGHSLPTLMNRHTCKTIMKVATVLLLGVAAYQIDHGQNLLAKFKTPIQFLFWVSLFGFVLLQVLPERLSGRLSAPRELPPAGIGRLLQDDTVFRSCTFVWLLLLYVAWLAARLHLEIGAFRLYLALAPYYLLYLWRSGITRQTDDSS